MKHVIEYKGFTLSAKINEDGSYGYKMDGIPSSQCAETSPLKAVQKAMNIIDLFQDDREVA